MKETAKRQQREMRVDNAHIYCFRFIVSHGTSNYPDGLPCLSDYHLIFFLIVST